MNSKLESINAVVVSLEQKLDKVQGRVEMLEQDQAKSKDAIKGAQSRPGHVQSVDDFLGFSARFHKWRPY